MLNIFLVRHWQNEDNVNGILNWHRDFPLTVLWEEQAKVTWMHLRESGYSFDHIYTSPLRRAHQTAEIISGELGLHAPIVLSKLIERDFWVMTWVPQSKILEMCSPNILQTEKINYFLDPEWAETFPDLIERAQVLLTEIKTMHTSWNIICTTHGDFWKMMYCAYYGLGWESVLRSFYFWNTDIVLLSEGISPELSHICLEEKQKSYT